VKPARTRLLIACLTLLVAALALCVDRARNGDLYLQLFTGRFITEHGLVSHDPFPTIGQGRPWLNQQWLSELGFYAAAKSVGITGVTILYAALIAAPLALVLSSLRRKGAGMLLAASALYFPGLLAIIHPRPAGFTLLAFSALVVIILAAWRPQAPGETSPRRVRWAVVAIPALFVLWGNLHAGFVAGLLLIVLVSAGWIADERRTLVADALMRHRVVLLGVSGLLGTAAVTLATPLGGDIWTYVLSFRDPAISLASKEWEPALQSPWATAYLAVVALFSGWLWWRSPSPRRLMPVLVVAGFVVFAAFSIRNLIFVAPAVAFQIACSAPDRVGPIRRLPVAVPAVAAAAAVMAYIAVLGPAGKDAVAYPAVRYALHHPPKHGRIAAYAGAASYILWRSPRTPVVIDGWLENFHAAELRGNYGILRGWWNGNPTRTVRRLDVGAVIAHLPVAIQALQNHGFVVEYAGPGGAYLVREHFTSPNA
jgi:MFS family permease